MCVVDLHFCHRYITLAAFRRNIRLFFILCFLVLLTTKRYYAMLSVLHVIVIWFVRIVVFFFFNQKGTLRESREAPRSQPAGRRVALTLR